ncbi:MAG: methylglyoxal synthase [Clostridia bacterium]|nr:methylglyoxal synthase [Clostridia bacterium]
MQIALIAHDDKKELLTQFCIAYCGILSKHRLCATATTARVIGEATGLEIKPLLSGLQGGGEQIASRIAYGEVDVLFYFRSTATSAEYGEGDDLIRQCDANNVPLATNLATAEAVILALDRGDLDWRENMR